MLTSSRARTDFHGLEQWATHRPDLGVWATAARAAKEQGNYSLAVHLAELSPQAQIRLYRLLRFAADILKVREPHPVKFGREELPRAMQSESEEALQAAISDVVSYGYSLYEEPELESAPGAQ